MRRAVGIAFHGDGWHRDDRTLHEPPLEIVISRFALGEAKPPAVIMNHDRHMVGIIEGLRAAIERGIVKIPFWGSELPDQLREIMTVLDVTRAATLGREIELIPPLPLGSRWQR